MPSAWKTVVRGLLALAFPCFFLVSEAAGQYGPTQNGRIPAGIAQQRAMQQAAQRHQGGAVAQQGAAQQGLMQQGAAQQGAAQQGKKPPAPPASKDTFNIIEIGKEYQVVSSSGMKDLKKRIEDEYKSAKKAYDDAKKDKNNKGAVPEKPEHKSIKTIKSGIKTQEKADEELKKLQNEHAKSDDKKSKR